MKRHVPHPVTAEVGAFFLIHNLCWLTFGLKILRFATSCARSGSNQRRISRTISYVCHNRAAPKKSRQFLAAHAAVVM
jgi:hypothetical protein